MSWLDDSDDEIEESIQEEVKSSPVVGSTTAEPTGKGSFVNLSASSSQSSSFSPIMKSDPRGSDGQRGGEEQVIPPTIEKADEGSGPTLSSAAGPSSSHTPATRSAPSTPPWLNGEQQSSETTGVAAASPPVNPELNAAAGSAPLRSTDLPSTPSSASSRMSRSRTPNRYQYSSSRTSSGRSSPSPAARATDRTGEAEARPRSASWSSSDSSVERYYNSNGGRRASFLSSSSESIADEARSAADEEDVRPVVPLSSGPVEHEDALAKRNLSDRSPKSQPATVTDDSMPAANDSTKDRSVSPASVGGRYSRSTSPSEMSRSRTPTPTPSASASPKKSSRNHSRVSSAANSPRSVSSSRSSAIITAAPSQVVKESPRASETAGKSTPSKKQKQTSRFENPNVPPSAEVPEKPFSDSPYAATPTPGNAKEDDLPPRASTTSPTPTPTVSARRHTQASMSRSAELDEKQKKENERQKQRARLRQLKPVKTDAHFLRAVDRKNQHNKGVLSEGERRDREAQEYQRLQKQADVRLKEETKKAKKEFAAIVEAEKRRLEEKLRAIAETHGGRLPHVDRGPDFVPKDDDVSPGKSDVRDDEASHSDDEDNHGQEESPSKRNKFAGLSEDDIIFAAGVPDSGHLLNPGIKPKKGTTGATTSGNPSRTRSHRLPAMQGLTENEAKSQRTKALRSNYGNQVFVDGAVSDFLFGDNIRKSRLPTKFLKQQGKGPRQAFH